MTPCSHREINKTFVIKTGGKSMPNKSPHMLSSRLMLASMGVKQIVCKREEECEARSLMVAGLT